MTGNDFSAQLADYKQAIDDDIAAYSQHVQGVVAQQYGDKAAIAIDAFFAILARGGKRIRGALVMHGYAMSGGTDQQMILQTARAVEMFHAYILMIDDIQDRSAMRRGGPAAHTALAQYHHDHQLAGDAEHFGVSMALNGALAGAHFAEMVLSSLDADPELRISVLSIMNRTMSVTAHGQSHDLMNPAIADVSLKDIEHMMEWKTATYTILNPLHMGMVLAGADCHATDAITPYATHVGVAFQITDDIIGTFGTEADNGKNPMDDIREGKRTLLVVYALEKASPADQKFLKQMLGSAHITPEQFQRCKTILTTSGALSYAKTEATRHIDLALKSLGQELSYWDKNGVTFLEQLAQYITTRIN